MEVVVGERPSNSRPLSRTFGCQDGWPRAGGAGGHIPNSPPLLFISGYPRGSMPTTMERRGGWILAGDTPRLGWVAGPSRIPVSQLRISAHYKIRQFFTRSCRRRTRCRASAPVLARSYWEADWSSPKMLGERANHHNGCPTGALFMQASQDARHAAMACT